MSFNGISDTDQGGKSCAKSSPSESTVTTVPPTCDVDKLVRFVARDLIVGGRIAFTDVFQSRFEILKTRHLLDR